MKKIEAKYTHKSVKKSLKLSNKQLQIIDLQRELESAAKWDNAISLLVGKKQSTMKTFL